MLRANDKQFISGAFLLLKAMGLTFVRKKLLAVYLFATASLYNKTPKELIKRSKSINISFVVFRTLAVCWACWIWICQVHWFSYP